MTNACSNRFYGSSIFHDLQFEKDIVSFSGAQKKKALIAKSLSERVHLHVWDEPLNFVDVISRMQIEELLLEHAPTIIFVEHDSEFCKHIADKDCRTYRLTFSGG
ncbi:ATPase subunit of ABC transporter with duplicated ATPase domains [Paenibacillus brasilensis]|uniref:ATPase subunit of ABC transporter with duplicated ATPase domains n=1 Tax=Paenibacillus brasilensis TaxID=128574 RepID=A0ABU0L7H9_9BACL|nr:ATPase subunit of ABC transporter with duplicated ATPase domains [Paenibacillus brasilensis]